VETKTILEYFGVPDSDWRQKVGTIASTFCSLHGVKLEKKVQEESMMVRKYPVDILESVSRFIIANRGDQ
jgi:hypothetical protein